MKRLLKSGAIALVALILISTLSVIGFASGTGTEADPYIITTAEELQNINNNLSAYYILGNDIDLENADFTPIGNSTSGTFTGAFDGNGYTISNLNVYAGKYAGLFGCNEGVIKNVTLADFYVYGTRYIGGVVGDNTASGTVSDCITLSGEIYAEEAVIEIDAGGIIGHNSGAVYGVMKNYADVNTSSNGDCYSGGIIGKNDAVLTLTAENHGSVAGNCYYYLYGYTYYSYSGGIIGYSTANVTFTESFNKGNVISCNCNVTAGGVNYAGGLIGYGGGFVNITDCFNSASVSGKSGSGSDEYGGNAGGLAGYIAGTSVINNSYNSGYISAYYGSAGLAYYISGTATVNCCYNSGEIFNSYYGKSAGLLGEAYGTTEITQCFNTGFVNSANTAAAFVSRMGSNTVSFNDCYNTGDIRTNSHYAGVFVGYVAYEYGKINVENCYNTGSVVCSYYYGFIYGGSERTVYPVAINSYCLKGRKGCASEKDITCGVNFIDSEELKNPEALSGFDFEAVWEIDSSINNGFPVLRDNKPALTLNYGYMPVKVGNSLNLIAYKNGAQESVTWSVTNGSATVDSNGNAYFGSTGPVTITATDSEGNKANFNAWVYSPASAVTVDDISVNMNVTNASPSYSLYGSYSYEVVKSYESSDTSVFTVSPSGIITPVSVGTAYLTITLLGGASGTGKVEITANAVGLWLSPSNFSMFTGDTYQMSISTNPNPTTSEITWTSSDESVATVDENGLVTAVSAGASTIAVSTDNGYSATSIVTVKEKITEISFVEPSVTMYTNEKRTLRLNVQPDNFTENITYSVSDYSIYVYSSGVVRSYSTTGSFTVTATTESGLKAYCTVTVEDWPNVLTLSDESSATLQNYYLTIPDTYSTSVDNYIDSVDGFEYVAKASFENEANTYYGTGSTVTVYDNTQQEVITYSVVVQGDVTGDSVCDVIDCALVARNSTENAELEGAYLVAADYDYDETVTANDYQQVVNQALT